VVQPYLPLPDPSTSSGPALADLERQLWDAADTLRANSKLKASEYSVPVLGLIFLRFADHKFAQADAALAAAASPAATPRRRMLGKDDYKARGVLYLPPTARYQHLLDLPESAHLGQAINDAMRAVEAENEDLRDVLPKSYTHLDNRVLVELLRSFARIPHGLEGDAFGKIYEYFLGKFAMAEGQKGGEFFTPTALVQLIVAIMAPYHGRIYDPACGSGGMFVQSAAFVAAHQGRPEAAISVYGQEKTAETVRLCKMNLAVHGLGGEVRQGNTYYEDLHHARGQFDFVMANPPFNVDKVDRERIKDDPRFPLGIPRADNANYLWIQLFYSALNAGGRAGFVMANSAADARASEGEIRRRLIEAGVVDVLVAAGPNFFYTVTLPCTLWFLDRGKAGTPRADQVLFLDARHLYRQIDRAHRDWTPAQVEFLANIARLYRGEPAETAAGSADLLAQHFPAGAYRDVPGLCRVASRAEIAAQGWSLNPGRYVGVTDRPADDGDFQETLEALHEELEVLNAEARELEARIAENVAVLLGEGL